MGRTAPALLPPLPRAAASRRQAIGDWIEVHRSLNSSPAHTGPPWHREAGSVRDSVNPDARASWVAGVRGQDSSARSAAPGVCMAAATKHCDESFVPASCALYARVRRGTQRCHSGTRSGRLDSREPYCCAIPRADDYRSSTEQEAARVARDDATSDSMLDRTVSVQRSGRADRYHRSRTAGTSRL